MGSDTKTFRIAPTPEHSGTSLNTDDLRSIRKHLNTLRAGVWNRKQLSSATSLSSAALLGYLLYKNYFRYDNISRPIIKASETKKKKCKPGEPCESKQEHKPLISPYLYGAVGVLGGVGLSEYLRYRRKNKPTKAPSTKASETEVKYKPDRSGASAFSMPVSPYVYGTVGLLATLALSKYLFEHIGDNYSAGKVKSETLEQLRAQFQQNLAKAKTPAAPKLKPLDLREFNKASALGDLLGVCKLLHSGYNGVRATLTPEEQYKQALDYIEGKKQASAIHPDIIKFVELLKTNAQKNIKKSSIGEALSNLLYGAANNAGAVILGTTLLSSPIFAKYFLKRDKFRRKLMALRKVDTAYRFERPPNINIVPVYNAEATKAVDEMDSSDINSIPLLVEADKKIKKYLK